MGNFWSEFPITNISDDIYEYAFGCVVGAFVGDALGGPLEFVHNINEKKVDFALNQDFKSMNNNNMNSLGLVKGQITDDSELAMCLLHAFGEANGYLSLGLIESYFSKWIKSPPFDIGTTTRTSLTKTQQDNPNHKRIFLIVQRLNSSSQSNGSLMRITPQAVWCYKLSQQELFEAVYYQTMFTHCHENIIECCQLYCLAIQYLIQHNQDQDKFEKAYYLAMKNAKYIQDWFNEIEIGNLHPANKKNIGFAKIAFQNAFYYLKNKVEFDKAMREILLQGGDTDTNACIVGGLLGAAWGYKNIKEEWILSVLEAESERPEFLLPYNLKELVRKIIEVAPDKLAIPEIQNI